MKTEHDTLVPAEEISTCFKETETDQSTELSEQELDAVAGGINRWAMEMSTNSRGISCYGSE